MQAKPKIVKILVVALIASLVLGACGGGTTGKTWFNLPSVKVHLQPDGSARVFGINLGAVLPASQVQQWQSANIQKLEIRIGYNGVHIYANGAELPYLKWDQASVEQLQEILPRLPQVPNGQMIARALPWLRTIGLGAALNIPPVNGAAALDIPRWSGETDITAETPESLAIGPLTIGSLTFDPEGNMLIEGVPAANLEPLLGMSLPSLDANTLGLLNTLGAQNVQVSVHPNGIDLALNGEPLPSIAYDSARLSTLVEVLPAFVADPGLVETIGQVAPLLSAAQATVVVSFTGEQAVETELTPVNIEIAPDGSVRTLGFPVAGAGTVPADTVQQLQSAGVQRLDVSLQEQGLFLAANGQPLPNITWTGESLATVAGIAGPMVGTDAEGLLTLVQVATDVGPNVTLTVPPAEGAEAAEMPAEPVFELQPVEASPTAAMMRVTASVDANGNLTMLGGLSAEDFSQLGIALPALPPDLVNTLQTTGAQEIQLDTDPGALIVRLDGADALTVNYDEASLLAALALATPLVGDSPLADPAVNQLVREQIIPQFLPSDVNVVLSLQ